MTNASKERCENLACLCEVSVELSACSDFCGSPEGNDPHQIVCRCGHALCQENTERQLHGSAGKENPR
jgi:hypothetical protein